MQERVGVRSGEIRICESVFTKGELINSSKLTTKTH